MDSDLSNSTVLVVDDAVSVHRLLNAVLGSFGIGTVINAISGQEGLDVLKDSANKVDAIICDLLMPEMDGHEFVHHLHAMKDSRKSAIPVIILTGQNNMVDIKRAAKAGVQAYLIKPVDPKVLEKWLRDALSISAN